MTTLTAPAITLDEQDAAQDEALAPMPADVIALRERKLALQAQIDLLQEEIGVIKDTVGKKLEDAGLQGYVLGGKVHARRSEVITNRLDSQRLKEKHPQIWRAFIKPTHSVRVVIN
jgi:hypothetical protein